MIARISTAIGQLLLQQKVNFSWDLKSIWFQNWLERIVMALYEWFFFIILSMLLNRSIDQQVISSDRHSQTHDYDYDLIVSEWQHFESFAWNTIEWRSNTHFCSFMLAKTIQMVPVCYTPLSHRYFVMLVYAARRVRLTQQYLPIFM